jgi:hypothetical protein
MRDLDSVRLERVRPVAWWMRQLGSVLAEAELSLEHLSGVFVRTK